MVIEGTDGVLIQQSGAEYSLFMSDTGSYGMRATAVEPCGFRVIFYLSGKLYFFVHEGTSIYYLLSFNPLSRGLL